MLKSENINELLAALSKAQGSIAHAVKDSDNPYFKSKYADLAAVWDVARKPLADNGLSITQHPSADGNAVTVETVLGHQSGQWMSSTLTMLAKDATPQAIGSCVTYARRYALASVVGIASEIDDDGNAAQGHPAQHQQRKESSQDSPTSLGVLLDRLPTKQKVVSDMEVLTQEQGKALLALLAGNGWTKEDLKEYVGEKYGLNGLSEITNGHLIEIKKHFSVRKGSE